MRISIFGSPLLRRTEMEFGLIDVAVVAAVASTRPLAQSNYLRLRRASVHVDFHANLYFNNLRCFPDHLRTP
jgi:hypothetical protein